MILGLSVHAFTILHVVISLIAIASGLVVVVALIRGRRSGGMTALFLATTALTSVTGFLFPIGDFTPALGTGAVSLAILALALIALYARHLAGPWRAVYIVAAVAALYLNVLVLIVQSFQKVAVLHPLAPNGNEPPFLIAQTLALLLFVILGTLAVRNYRPAAG